MVLETCTAEAHNDQLTNAIGSEDASPIIRVPWGEEWMIKRALDAGAHGIMTPMCHNEVRAVSNKSADRNSTDH